MNPMSLTAGLVLLLGAAQAQAADSFLEIINASGSRVSTGSNRVLGAGQAMVIGSLRSVIDASQQASITYSLVGASTPVIDHFQAGGYTMLSNGGGQGTITTAASSGLLDLAFGLNPTAVPWVSNAGNFDGTGANFGVVLHADRQSGYLLFEDALLGADYDYDDMVVRFKLNVSTTAPVPEPSSVVLSLAGLGLLAGLARRRQRRAPGA